MESYYIKKLLNVIDSEVLTYEQEEALECLYNNNYVYFELLVEKDSDQSIIIDRFGLLFLLLASEIADKEILKVLERYYGVNAHARLFSEDRDYLLEMGIDIDNSTIATYIVDNFSTKRIDYLIKHGWIDILHNEYVHFKADSNSTLLDYALINSGADFNYWFNLWCDVQLELANTNSCFKKVIPSILGYLSSPEIIKNIKDAEYKYKKLANKWIEYNYSRSHDTPKEIWDRVANDLPYFDHKNSLTHLLNYCKKGLSNSELWDDDDKLLGLLSKSIQGRHVNGWIELLKDAPGKQIIKCVPLFYNGIFSSDDKNYKNIHISREPLNEVLIVFHKQMKDFTPETLKLLNEKIGGINGVLRLWSDLNTGKFSNGSFTNKEYKEALELNKIKAKEILLIIESSIPAELNGKKFTTKTPKKIM